MVALPTLPDAIRATRVALGYTQGTLGHLVGVTQSEVSRWESGERTPLPPTHDQLHQLATGPRIVVPQARGPYRVQLVLPQMAVWEVAQTPLFQWSEQQLERQRIAEERRRLAERKRAAAEERRRAAAERKRQAEERRRELEGKRRAAAERKRRAEELRAEELRQRAAKRTAAKQKAERCKVTIRRAPRAPHGECENYDRACYPTRAAASRAFVAWNQDAAQAWGIDIPATGGEFDAVNERYGRRGRRKVKTLGDAVLAAVPADRPFCLDRVDVETLNDTVPGHEYPFTMPEPAIARWAEQQQRAYAEYLEQMGGMSYVEESGAEPGADDVPAGEWIYAQPAEDVDAPF